MKLMDKIMQVVQLQDGTVLGDAIVKHVHLKAGKMYGKVRVEGRSSPVQHIGNGCWQYVA